VKEVRSLGGSLTYQIGTRNANTVLRLKDGETQVLAGLISEEQRGSSSGIPGLANLPVLGRLFSSKSDENIKTEIVLLITPHILRNAQAQQPAISEFRGGTENAIGGGTDAPSSMMAEQKFPQIQVAPPEPPIEPPANLEVEPNPMTLPSPPLPSLPQPDQTGN
jgi:general secretion pathway protein D